MACSVTRTAVSPATSFNIDPSANRCVIFTGGEVTGPPIQTCPRMPHQARPWLRLPRVASGSRHGPAWLCTPRGPVLYFIAITLLRLLAPRGSAGRQFAQRYGVVAPAA
jgi:hypothetical protein